MSDRSHAQISIGGTIDRTTPSKSDPEESVLDVMISMINGAGVTNAEGGAVAEIPINAEDDDDSQLLQYLDGFDDGEELTLRFRDDQARNGEFDELERFLRDNNIPYRRWSEAAHNYLAEDVYWVPGMLKALTIFCNMAGDELVSMDDVRVVLNGMERPRSYQVHVDSVKRQLQALCPEPPEIPPFKIVGEKA